MPPPESNSPPSSNPKQRITQCALCHYELTNQPTTYINEYHLIAVRCPECGQQQPAGITTQPWRYRKLKYTFMLSIWVVLLLTAIFSVPIALASMSQSTAYASLKPFAKHISTLQAQSDPKYHVSRWNDTFNPRYELNSDWWTELGKQQAADTFNPAKHIDWIVFTDWLWFLLIAPGIALLYYATLCRSDLSTKVIAWLCSFALAALSTYLTLNVNFHFYYYASPQEAAMQTAAAPIAWSTFAFGTTTILIAYALTPRLLTLLNKHLRNQPKDPNTL